MYRSDKDVDGLDQGVDRSWSDLDDNWFDSVYCINDFDLFYKLQDSDGQKALDDNVSDHDDDQDLAGQTTNIATPSDRCIWKVAQYRVKMSISKG